LVGVEYNDIEYRSLSASAAAAAKDLGIKCNQVNERTRAGMVAHFAAKDLGIKCNQVNGFLFWNLAKAVARPVDPMGALNRAWERFHERASSLLADAKNDEVLATLFTALGRHIDQLEDMVRGR